MMNSRQTSIGRDAAIALAETEWWKGKTAEEIVRFQLFTEEMSMPFKKFHEAVEAALGRPVYTHEFGSGGMEQLMGEFLGLTPAPTMEEIINMIPEEKRILVVR